MKRPTNAGMKVLNSFRRRSDDPFDIAQQRLERICMRSGLRSVNVYRTVEKLIADGFLESKYGIEGFWYSLTDAGKEQVNDQTPV